jgi:hypothetical protein
MHGEPYWRIGQQPEEQKSLLRIGVVTGPHHHFELLDPMEEPA